MENLTLRFEESAHINTVKLTQQATCLFFDLAMLIPMLLHGYTVEHPIMNSPPIVKNPHSNEIIPMYHLHIYSSIGFWLSQFFHYLEVPLIINHCLDLLSYIPIMSSSQVQAVTGVGGGMFSSITLTTHSTDSECSSQEGTVAGLGVGVAILLVFLILLGAVFIAFAVWTR